jgi:predicted short-subunit dehydrogenase-like oxidoreductase (DUF2520 family)
MEMNKVVRTMTIVGCGNVGKTLGRLWTQSGTVSIQCVLNRSAVSSQNAVDFIGAGAPITEWAAIPASDIFMLSVSDDAVRTCVSQLCGTGVLRTGNLVFHCSGALSSDCLSETQQYGAVVGSVHPVKSFANVQAACDSFAGTYCAIEGDAPALEVLNSLFELIGGILFSVEAAQKTIYHAGAVIVCNYFVALLEAGLRCYEKAGIERAVAYKVIRPFVQGTLDNVFALDTARALSGPIARGDLALIQRQYCELRQWSPALGRVYSELGVIAVDLAQIQGRVSEPVLSAIREVFRGDDSSR